MGNPMEIPTLGEVSPVFPETFQTDLPRNGSSKTGYLMVPAIVDGTLHHLAIWENVAKLPSGNLT